MKEYFLIMKELAARGSIETEALIQYIIDGIPDDSGNKVVLYGASKLREFKNKLDIYSTLRNRGQDGNNSSRRNHPNNTGGRNKDSSREAASKGGGAKNSASVIKCFNCGNTGHVVAVSIT